MLGAKRNFLSIEPLAKFKKNAGLIMKFFWVWCFDATKVFHACLPSNRANLPEAGQTTPPKLSPWLVPHRSAYQLEQLVGKQGNNAKHQMQPDLRHLLEP